MFENCTMWIRNADLLWIKRVLKQDGEHETIKKCSPDISKKALVQVFSRELCEILQNSFFKGALSGPRQFLANESSLKMMKNAFYLTLKALYVLKIFTARLER